MNNAAPIRQPLDSEEPAHEQTTTAALAGLIEAKKYGAPPRLKTLYRLVDSAPNRAPPVRATLENERLTITNTETYSFPSKLFAIVFLISALLIFLATTFGMGRLYFGATQILVVAIPLLIHSLLQRRTPKHRQLTISPESIELFFGPPDAPKTFKNTSTLPLRELTRCHLDITSFDALITEGASAKQVQKQVNLWQLAAVRQLPYQVPGIYFAHKSGLTYRFELADLLTIKDDEPSALDALQARRDQALWLFELVQAHLHYLSASYDLTSYCPTEIEGPSYYALSLLPDEEATTLDSDW